MAERVRFAGGSPRRCARISAISASTSAATRRAFAATVSAPEGGGAWPVAPVPVLDATLAALAFVLF